MKIETPHYTIYQGNALDILPQLQADCIVTDPPYLLTSGGNTDHASRIGGAFGKGKYNNNGKIVDCPHEWPEFMKPMYDALRSPGHAYFMANDKNQFEMQYEAMQAGFYFHNLLNWRKGTCTQNRWYMKDTEYIGFFGKGEAFAINNCGSKQSADIPQRDESGEYLPAGEDGSKDHHPTEKPVRLMRHYILNSTQKGESVLDPFMGSGTTGVAAIMEGRRFIGIEMNAKWFGVAQARLDKAVRNLLGGEFGHGLEQIEMF